ncbi:DUF4880 domain-containing protein, partial [Xanthomonas sacchari]|uniref:DUF4880 domain-containing protein n=1 Tax=Xanthomonas sacchari TaxID=56458 RepID=UPI000262A3B9
MNDSAFSSRSAIADAAHWHAVQRMQPLDAKQEQQLLDWLTASPQHLREYLAMQRVAGDLGEALRGMDLDVDALLASDAAADGAASDNVIALPVPRRAPAAAPARA